ncbi:MAG TPA: tetratricopeptide repeat protein [Stellaceae bacterium]|nr:tetratricopeptide repeat protein [Stellaceae bacterium]
MSEPSRATQHFRFDQILRLMPATFAIIAAAFIAISSAARAQSYDQLKGWCYGDATDDQTIEGCNAVIRANKESKADLASAYANLGFAYGNERQYDKAIASCDSAIAIDPKIASAYINRGIAYEAQGQHERAIKDYDLAIGLKPRDANIYNNRGLAYAAMGQYRRAIQDYDEALRLDFNFARAFYNRGIAKQKVGDREGAEMDLHTARQLDPQVGN